MSDYFQDQGVDFPKEVNPAEYVIDVVSGDLSRGRDWAQVWLESSLREKQMEELENIKRDSAQRAPPVEDDDEYASTFSQQVAIVCERAFVQVGPHAPPLTLALARRRVHHEQVCASHQRRSPRRLQLL